MIKFLFDLLFNKSQFKLGETTEPKKPEFSSIPNNHGETFMKEYITVDDILTSSGKYPERAKHPECTIEVKSNAAKLCDAINGLFTDLKYTGKLSVNSGFRTSDVNKSIPNAAKKSNHLLGLAVDFTDSDNKIDELLTLPENDVLLKKHKVWVEDPFATRYWNHCDIRDRGVRSKNVFKP